MFCLQNRVLAGGFSVKVESAMFDVFLLFVFVRRFCFACFLEICLLGPLKRGDPEQPKDHFEVRKIYFVFIFLVLCVGFAFGCQKGSPGDPREPPRTPAEVQKTTKHQNTLRL